MYWTPRRQQFRTLLAGSECVYPGSVFDPLSARMANDLGFEVAMFAGSIASLTVLGAPDLIVLNQAEFAAQAYRVCRAADIPLIVDADHGYGNALNVRRTVEELESSGVSAMTIEDTVLPKRHGSSATEFVSIEEGVGKMQAALEARQDPDLVIAGRTSALASNGLDDTIKRLNAYEASGVDMLMLVGIKQRDDLEAIADSVSIPLMLGGVSAELMDRQYLAGLGVRICLQGHQPFMAAIQATYATLKALRDGVPTSELTGLPEKALQRQLMREDDYQQWVDNYL
ncbi:MAG: carboxyvinyl-carboxyphosphonate phosphorylmutase [Parasphingorhabdus sp.]|jgi:carboxyvinyl-carboxyphosphonate phosphorylmutase